MLSTVTTAPRVVWGLFVNVARVPLCPAVAARPRQYCQETDLQKWAAPPATPSSPYGRSPGTGAPTPHH